MSALADSVQINPLLLRKKFLPALLLLVVSAAAYWPVGDFSFVNYDDNIYITQVPQMQQGLTWESLSWAATTKGAVFWRHPLTWVSHMLAVEMFGLNPAGHHWVNVLLHMASVLLLFVILERMTGAVWRSALVAGLFALHPLNVESVAWVAERKNVLSTLMWMVVLGAYVSYAKEPLWKRYWVLMGVFVLGLMTKPMLVTLPCVFVLLDYWPLGRLGNSSQEVRQRLWPLLREKLPLLVPVGLSSLLAVKAESQLGSLTGLEALPVGVRLGNAVVSYGLYLKKMVWPVDLAVFYPHPGSSLALWWGGVVRGSANRHFVRVWQRRWRSRYLVTGWLWYLGTLFPVIGLIQVGAHGMADRYAYVPLIGVFIMLAWGVVEAGERVRVRGEWLALAWIGVLAPDAGGNPDADWILARQHHPFSAGTEHDFKQSCRTHRSGGGGAGEKAVRRGGAGVPDSARDQTNIRTSSQQSGIAVSRAGEAGSIGDFLFRSPPNQLQVHSGTQQLGHSPA